MPITRRKRANPPDQPENNNNHIADQPENSAEQQLSAEPPPAPVEGEPAQSAEVPAADTTTKSAPEAPAARPMEAMHPPLPPVVPSQIPVSNGDRVAERQDYTPTIEGGRRTARGEWFRRPPQPPPPQQIPQPSPASFAASAPLQAPTHEITLPLGNLLHLAYNPSYTGSEEARSLLLHRLTDETKAGGRARCWNCGSIAIAYDRWSTRSRTFGEVGVAFCEICGVWSVM